MSWQQGVIAIAGATAWPVAIFVSIVVLKRTFSNANHDQHIAALSPTVREAMRTSGITVYPTDPRTKKVLLDRPLQRRHVRGFDKRHPDFERRYADL